MARLLTLVALFLLSVSQTVLSSPCIAFDASWNLFAFGLNGKDYNAATQDKWTGSKLHLWPRSTSLTNSACALQVTRLATSRFPDDRKSPLAINLRAISLVSITDLLTVQTPPAICLRFVSLTAILWPFAN
jgi:hypothetical protein